MLPDPTDSPTGGPQLVVVETITLHVAIEFCRPPGPVRRWSRRMLRTPVPEAAVNEHRQTYGAEDDVSLTSEPYYWSAVLSEAEAGPVQGRSNPQLKGGVFGPV